MNEQDGIWRRAWASSLALVAGLAAAAGCDGSMSISSSTNWLTCQTHADCAGFLGATCNDEEICIDASGSPIPANATRDGLVSGAGGAGGSSDECDEPSSSTLCLSAGGNGTSGGAGGSSAGAGGNTTGPELGSGGSGGALGGGSGGESSDVGGASSTGGSSGGTTSGVGGANAAGAGGGATDTCECETGQYCEQTSCDIEGPGECAPMPELCTANFAPVCGCNGQTFSNACAAASAGINVDTTDAACEEPRVVLTIVVSTLGTFAYWYNGTEDVVYLRGCSTVDAWYRDGDDWVEYGPLASCTAETEVVELNPNGLHAETLPEAPARGDDVWRLTGPYGVGCTPGALFSEAGCDEVVEVTSFNETDWGR